MPLLPALGIITACSMGGYIIAYLSDPWRRIPPPPVPPRAMQVTIGNPSSDDDGERFGSTRFVTDRPAAVIHAVYRTEFPNVAGRIDVPLYVNHLG
ncbi:MAG: hypothetical protein M3120_04985 [Pseudomonadota bacterium]|nr:hypothetical protein [Pseudomonadota bacterium]